MSATRPANEFSIGIMPRSASPRCDRLKAILEGRLRHRLAIGKDLQAGDVRVGARLALKDDTLPAKTLSLLMRIAPSIGARPLQILRRVDAERHLVDDRHVDPHAGFERPQLLQLLALLQRARRKPTKRSSAARR